MSTFYEARTRGWMTDAEMSKAWNKGVNEGCGCKGCRDIRAHAAGEHPTPALGTETMAQVVNGGLK